MNDGGLQWHGDDTTSRQRDAIWHAAPRFNPAHALGLKVQVFRSRDDNVLASAPPVTPVRVRPAHAT
jgi:hypothetical protein